MTISTGISTTLNTDLVALSNQVQSSDTTIKGDQRVAELAAKVLNDIDQESSLLSPMSKKYIEDIKSIIETKAWDKLPSSIQINSDIELFNKLGKDITFASEFVGVDINDVLSMLLEFERKNSSIQSQMRLESRDAMFKAANEEFNAKARANSAELAAGITSGVAGAVGGLFNMGGGAMGLHYARKSINSSHQNLKLSDKLSNENTRLDNFKISKNEIDKKIDIVANKPPSKSSDPKELQKIQDEKIILLNKKEEIDMEINDASNQINILSSKVKSNNDIITSENQIAVNASTLIGGFGKISESLIQIGASVLRNQQKTEEINAEKYALTKNIANESNQAANDAYQQARDQMHSIIQSLQSITQDLHSSMSKQVSMA